MARNLIGAAKPTKNWDDLTEEEQDAFVAGLYQQIKTNLEASQKQDGDN